MITIYAEQVSDEDKRGCWNCWCIYRDEHLNPILFQYYVIENGKRKYFDGFYHSVECMMEYNEINYGTQEVVVVQAWIPQVG